MLALCYVKPGVLEIASFGKLTGVEWEISKILFYDEGKVDELLQESLAALHAQGIASHLHEIEDLYWDLIGDDD